MKKIFLLFILSFGVFSVLGFADEPLMQITSKAFQNNEMIPKKYTCRGENFSPPLEIVNIPEKAQSLVLLMSDPDAGSKPWVHWAVYDVVVRVQRRVDIDESSGQFGRMGKNSWGERTYGGPCPPSGLHRYFFKAYALDKFLSLPEGTTPAEIEAAMQGHIVAQAEMMGTYEKK